MNNSLSESSKDEDLGSGGVLLLPDVRDASGNIRHLGTGGVVGTKKKNALFHTALPLFETVSYPTHSLDTSRTVGVFLELFPQQAHWSRHRSPGQHETAQLPHPSPGSGTVRL